MLGDWVLLLFSLRKFFFAVFFLVRKEFCLFVNRGVGFCRPCGGFTFIEP